MWDNSSVRPPVCLWIMFRTCTVLRSLRSPLDLVFFRLSVSLFSFLMLHLSLSSLPDSWQRQSGIRAVQTSASRTEDL